MTRRVSILLRILEKNCKKVKIEVTGTKKHSFWLIHLKIFHSSNFQNLFFSSFVEKLNISAIYKFSILIFSLNLLVISSYKFCRKEIISNHQENFEDNISVNFNKERRNCLIWTLYFFVYQCSIIQSIQRYKRSDFKLASKFQNISIGNFKTS